MNKEEIERIALEVADSITAPFTSATITSRIQMDKQLILKHALGAMRNIASCGAFGPKIDVTEEMASIELMDEEGRAITAALFAEFLARIDAERGKWAVGYDALFNAIADATNADAGAVTISVRMFEESIGGKLFLSPTIPEGMALVPIEPTEAMMQVHDDLLMQGVNRGRNVIYAAMIAAAQGERNAD